MQKFQPNSKTICPYCKKERRAELMFRITRKYYKHTPICNLCYSQYTQGKKLVNNKWVGIRIPQSYKKSLIYFPRDRKRKSEDSGRIKQNISYEAMLDYWD